MLKTNKLEDGLMILLPIGTKIIYPILTLGGVLFKEATLKNEIAIELCQNAEVEDGNYTKADFSQLKDIYKDQL